MFSYMFLVPAVMDALAEEERFQEWLKTLPPEEREQVNILEEAYLAKRAALRAEEQRERERQEYLEAVKPHTLWSWLGLGRK